LEYLPQGGVRAACPTVRQKPQVAAVVGSIILFTAVIFVAGKPLI